MPPSPAALRRAIMARASGCQGAWVMAMRCSAALGCLLPVRDKRWRARLDDQTGSGAVPGVAGVGVLGAESVDAGGLTEDLRRGQRPHPQIASSDGARCLTSSV